MKHGDDFEVHRLLSDLARCGAQLTAAGGKLQCHMAAGTLPEEVAERIRRHKQALLRQLAHASRGSLPRLRCTLDEFPTGLSCGQTRIWLHEELQRDSMFYVVPTGLRLCGPIDVARLQQAWARTVLRHASLRTLVDFATSPPLQSVTSAAPSLAVEDLGAQPLDARAVHELCLSQARQEISLRQNRLVSATLYRQGNEEHLLLLILHHIVTDGWSTGVLLQDVIAFYAAEGGDSAAAPSPLAANYFDYVVWQKEYLASPVFRDDLAYWCGSLQGAPTHFDAPLRPSHRDGQGIGTGTIERPCGPDLYPRMAAWAAHDAGTPYSLMLAAWATLLHLWSDERDIILGTVVAGRPHTHLEPVVGCFMNTLPLRCRVNPDLDFASLHRSVRTALVEGLEHQHCPIDRIVAAVNPPRQAGRNPIFNIGLLLQNFPLPPQQADMLRVDVVPIAFDGLSLDLRLIGLFRNGELVLKLEYNREWLDATTAEVLLENYCNLMERATQTHGAEPLVRLRSSVDWGPLGCRKRFVLAATFTADPIATAFQFWRSTLGLPYSLAFAPYAQVMQGLLAPDGPMRLHADHAGVIVRLRDWALGDEGPEQERLLVNVRAFCAACRTFRAATDVPLTIWVCPSAAVSVRPGGLAATMDESESILAAELAALPEVQLHGRATIAARFPVDWREDDFLDHIGHLGFMQEIHTVLGTLVARELAARVRPALKAVVVDADETLWRGICGEVPADALVLDDACRTLQVFLKELNRKGVALCLCSKNNEEDVRLVFSTRTDMLLRREDFSASRVNWRPKSENIRAIARELDIGLDSILFIDDNPAETEEVEAACPEVRCLSLPAQRADMESFLHGVWDFDVAVSPQAAARLETYRLNSKREQLRAEALDLSGYVASLQVRLDVRALRAEDLARAAELTQRTNQFTFRTVRRSTAQLARECGKGGLEALVIEVSDRFGDYGLTGLVLHRVTGGRCRVDTFLLSCRVLGKGVEQAVVARLRELMARRKVDEIEFELLSSGKNEPALTFARECLGPPLSAGGGRQLHRIAISTPRESARC